MFVDRGRYILFEVGHPNGNNKKFRIYLDTSIPNHLFAEDRLDWMASTWKLWEKIACDEYGIFVSDVLFEELDRCPEPKQSKIYEQLGRVKYERLPKTPEATSLAMRYIEHGVLKEKDYGDCLHIAYATTGFCDNILSWNFRHLVNDETISKVQAINAASGYNKIIIVSPDTFFHEATNEHI